MKKTLTRIRNTARNWVMKQLALSGVDSNRGWVRIFGSGLGFQTDTKYSKDDIIGHPTVYSCGSLIAGDGGKLALRLMTLEQGVWVETTSSAFSPVLRKPNHFQTRQQFIETWILSKLFNGNTYVLKVRDARRVVVGLYVLDPNRVTPLVAPDGSVYYQLQRDDLSKLPIDYPAVPASEIIHDRDHCLFHPLVGIPPLWAATLTASAGLRILQNSEKFFKNASRPGGLLTTPNEIDDEDADQLKETWEKSFTGENAGRLAVVGNDLKYMPMAATAHDSQLVEQLALSAEYICSVFHVPAFMVGVGSLPSYDNTEALTQQYYGTCLQRLFNAIEDLLDDGLNLTGGGYRVEFDLNDLWRLDMLKQAEVLEKLAKAGMVAPNEGRARLGYKPVAGGESPYLQQQNWQLGQLASRKAPPDGNELPPAPDGEAKFWRDLSEMGTHADEFIKSLPLRAEREATTRTPT